MADIEPNDRNARKILSLIRTKKDSFWSREREQRPLRLFHEAARRVPAYKDFLKKNHVNPEKIKTFKDFELLPSVDKNNYLRKYPLEKVCWDGNLDKSLVFTSTSGSTGDPFFFPRGHKLDWQYSILIEQYLKQSSFDTAGPTLVIIGFGMGVWIGGLITYKAFEISSHRGHPVSIITPGINKPEIFHILRNLAPNYKQVILVGYPPFIKDVIDESVGQGVKLNKINLRLLFAAESFNEKFRDYLIKKTGIRNLYLDTLNVYGTADIGAMAYETPAAILARRLILNKKETFKNVFSDISKTPTLAQYNPFFMTFEAKGGEILLTGDNTIPLIRYAIGDHGGVINFTEITKKLRDNGMDFWKEAKKVGIEKTISEQPFVYVFERSDFSTKLYGAIIYPEPIREALLHEDLENLVTGKFTMTTKYDRHQNQIFEVHVELKSNTRPSEHLKKICEDIILKHLLEKNAEYRNNYSSIPHRVRPKIFLWQYEHPLHFKPGIKQKWVKK